MNVYCTKLKRRCGGIGCSAENWISVPRIYQLSWSALGSLGTQPISSTNTPLRLSRPRRAGKLKAHCLSVKVEDFGVTD